MCVDEASCWCNFFLKFKTNFIKIIYVQYISSVRGWSISNLWIHEKGSSF